MIRLANKFDFPEVLRMLKDFRKYCPVDSMTDIGDEIYFAKLYNSIINGRGFILVAEKEQLVGMLVSVIDQNIWDPKVLVLKELAYWVEPEYRHTTVGYRLITEYNKIAKNMVEHEQIKFYTMSKLINSPDLDYGRFNYQKIEETWIAGV